MPADDELMRQLGQALAPEERAPDPARVAALRAAAAERMKADSPPVPPGQLGQPGSRPSRFGLAVLGAAAAVAVAIAVGAVVLLGGDDRGDQRALEFETTLRAPRGEVTADVTGFRTGIGRIVEFRTDELAILAKGDYYEVWFVGPGDRPGTPNRISAGTFHPDEKGRTDIELTAAVDPTKYPGLSVTVEPGDGNPGPSGLEVLRATIEVID